MSSDKGSDNTPKDEAGGGFPKDFSTKDKGLNRYITLSPILGNNNVTISIAVSNANFDKVVEVVDFIESSDLSLMMSQEVFPIDIDKYEDALSKISDFFSEPDLPQEIIDRLDALDIALRNKIDENLGS